MPTVKAIDVHGHYGVSRDQKYALTNGFMSADAREVVRRAKTQNVAVTVVSPLAGLMAKSRHAVERANREAAKVVAGCPGMLQWAILDPLNERTFDQVKDLMTGRLFAGVKIHPELHGYAIRKYGRAIFEFAERQGLVVMTHSGQKHSLPEDFVGFANCFPGARLILAHLGFGYDQDPSHQVRAIQKSRHGNVFTDTSSSKSLTPNLIEWAVDEVGADRILFGSDTPLYSVAMQRARIDRAEIRESEKRLILRGNAERLFGVRVQGGTSC